MSPSPNIDKLVKKLANAETNIKVLTSVINKMKREMQRMKNDIDRLESRR